MTDLRDPLEPVLDDLVAEVPSYVVPDARAAWAAGARRRRLRRIGAVAAVVVLVALTAGLVNVLPRSSDVPPADGEQGGVDGYPSRIEKPWFLRDLPARPGPVAGLLVREGGEVLAVGPTGSVWRLPQDDAMGGYPVAVSPDGRRVAYFADHDTFMLRDLVAGETTVVGEVGDGTFRGDREDHDTDHTYFISMQAPAFFSPDGETVFVLGGPTDPQAGSGALLVGADGSTSFVPAPGGARRTHWPAGWAPSGDLVWFGADFTRGRPRWARTVITDATGRQLRAVDLTVPGRLRGVSQWTGAVSPDGELMALTTEESARTFVMSLRSGDLQGVVAGHNHASQCPVSWSVNTPRMPRASEQGTLVVDGDARPLVQVAPGVRAACGIWATDALSGEQHRDIGSRVFGTGTGWLSWHWREVLLGGAATLLAIAGLVLYRHRRTSREG